MRKAEIGNVRVVCPEAAGPEAEHLGEVFEALVKGLARYRLPRRIAARAGMERAADAKEEWLVVVCAPGTPGDEAVGREIGSFIARGCFSRILTLLADGSPDTSFPRSLRFETKEDGSVVEHEPLAANISGAGKAWKKKLATEQFRILAPVFGVRYDDLLDRKRKARNRRRLAAGAAALAAALAFLAYAVNRMQLISAQNRELSAQYGAAAEARDEAARQKDAAFEAYVRTVALEARAALAEGKGEKALALLLEVPPEMQDTEGVPETLEETLRALCAGGYVPVASKADYLASRNRKAPAGSSLPRSVTLFLPPPPEADTEAARIRYDLRAESEEYGFMILSGSAGGISATLVHYPESPEKDYFLRDEEGGHYSVLLSDNPVRHGGVGIGCSAVVLPDGSLIDIHRGEAKRADIRTGRFIPFFDEGGAEGSLAQKGESGYTHILDYPGCDVLLALTGDGTEVWQRSPFRYLYTLEGIADVVDPGGTKVLAGSGRGLTVFSRNPFRELYTVPEGIGTDTPAEDEYITAAECADGRSWLTCGWAAYDLDTGALVRSFGEEGQSVPTSFHSPLFTSDGLALVPGFRGVTLWDPDAPDTPVRIRSIAGPDDWSFGDYQPYGPEDPETGLRDSSAILLDGIVFVRREPREIPPDTAGRLALAAELLALKD